VNQNAVDYAKNLINEKVPRELIHHVKSMLDLIPQISDEFKNPGVEIEKKHLIIDRIFPKDIRNFLKILCDNNDFELIDDIIEKYMELSSEPVLKSKRAKLTYVTAPSFEQLAAIRAFVEKKTGNEDVNIDLKQDPSLKSGFILRIGDVEYDWSEKGRINQLASSISQSIDYSHKKDDDDYMASTDSIMSILRTNIRDFELSAKNMEVGLVVTISDGIATIDGLDHAFYGEIVVFDCGVKGMVQDIKKEEIGVILFGFNEDIKEGSRVVRTGKMAGIPVGEAFLGRVVDALGTPIDAKGEIEASAYRPIENPAPSIVDREGVSVPLETGILSIDSMFPIGRGQRELIIGDRQTGKTSLATDTIINQKGKNVICIYVAIGQKASTVAQLVNNLKNTGAMDYTIVLASTSSDSAPLQYIAPYSGCALAEYFMYEGKDVLIIYDDLSKHAVAYRSISLLLERSPGREAYPGDVFYLHSRLLERASRITKERGGGSITALPIIETQAGDVSAYIPTNVISITDGQIFLESDLFNSGFRPAVNVGLSVSRVGGAAQTKAMKKAAGSIRIDLAQYREMEVFTQFSSDLDEGTLKQLGHGKALMEMLKQPLLHPLTMAEEVISLVVANSKLFDPLPLKELKSYQAALLEHFDKECKPIVSELDKTKELSDDLKDKIIDEAKGFYETYMKDQKKSIASK